MIMIWPRCVALVLLCAAVGFSTNMVIQRYQLKQSDSRVSMAEARLENVSLVMCCEACKKLDTCRGFSYHGNGSNPTACELTNLLWQNALKFAHQDAGWNTYARQYGCPDAIESFKSVGGTRLFICSTVAVPDLLKQSEARTACRQFGNLVKIDSTEKLDEISIEIRKQAVTGEFWVDGHRGPDNRTWYYSDYTKIPIKPNHIWAANQPSTVGGACLAVNSAANYKLANKECGEQLGYICEIP